MKTGSKDEFIDELMQIDKRLGVIDSRLRRQCAESADEFHAIEKDFGVIEQLMLSKDFGDLVIRFHVRKRLDTFEKRLRYP